MVKLNSCNISIDKGVNPPRFKQPFKLFEATVSVDMGVIPPKNYFQEKISTAGIMIDKADASTMWYQVN